MRRLKTHLNCFSDSGGPLVQVGSSNDVSSSECNSSKFNDIPHFSLKLLVLCHGDRRSLVALQTQSMCTFVRQPSLTGLIYMCNEGVFIRVPIKMGSLLQFKAFLSLGALDSLNLIPSPTIS